MTAHPSRRRTGALWLAAVLVLAGCQLRLETPPPSEPVPDAAEQVRARAVDQAVTLEEQAGSAREGAAAAVAVVLDDVAAFSAAHAEALGGVYSSGLPEPTPSQSPTTPPPAAPDEVLAALRQSAASALADADQAPDGAMARLLAEVGTARDDLAARLAAALGEPLDELAEPTPSAAPTTPPASEAGDPPTASAAPTTSAAPTASPTGEGAPTAGVGLPPGMTDAAAVALVLAHDQAAYADEVIAAKSVDAARAAAQTAAAAHRAAAARWAGRAGVAGTPADPRRASYALPEGLDDPAVRTALAAGLEQAVAEAASAALPGVVAGARGELVDLLVAATAAARGLGAAPSPFPGSSDAAPERTPAPTGGATGGPARWPPLAGAGPLPTHLPQDAGPRPGATGTATAQDDGSFSYVVAAGDVLGAIGLRFFPDDSTAASVTLLQAVNAGTITGEAIRGGDTITIPNGRYTASG